MNEKTIFLRALEIESVRERAEYLNQACGDDVDLRHGVEALLMSHGVNDHMLDSPLFECSDADEDEIDISFLEECSKPQTLGKLGDYEIVEILGRGATSVVFKAFDPTLNRFVATKVLLPEIATNATARKRFVREARAVAAIPHAHINTIHAIVEHNKIPYLVLEFVDGITLQEKIEREGTLDISAVLRIGMQVAQGLAAAHNHGLIHRDIKPANILLENGMERVHLTDFGLARAVDDASLTKTGHVGGTPQYMSPEQTQGEPLDARSDLFSVGCVMYAMCTGRSPFRADSTIAVIRRVCDDMPRPIHEINSDVPGWLGSAIDRLLAKNPQDRFQSASELADLLRQQLATLEHPAQAEANKDIRPNEAPATGKTDARSSSPGVLVAVAILLVLVGGFAIANSTGMIRLGGVQDERDEGNSNQGRHNANADDRNIDDSHGVAQANLPPSDAAASEPVSQKTAGDDSRPSPLGSADSEPTLHSVAKTTAEPANDATVAQPAPSADETPFEILTSDEWEWTDPELLGPNVNSGDPDGRWSPHLSADGLTLLFDAGNFSSRAKDLWMCRRESVDAPFGEKIWLPVVNSRGINEAYPTMSADGRTLIFCRRYQEKTPSGVNSTNFDLWMSERTSTEEPWSEPVNLGTEINGPDPSQNIHPRLSLDGMTLTYLSLVPKKAFSWQRIQRASRDAPWQTPVIIESNASQGGPVNPKIWVLSSDDLVRITAFNEGQRTYMQTRTSREAPWSAEQTVISHSKLGYRLNALFLSADGRTLMFSAHLPRKLVSSQLWVMRRTKKPLLAADDNAP